MRSTLHSITSILLLTLLGFSITSPSNAVSGDWVIDTTYSENIIDISEVGKAEKITFFKARNVTSQEVFDTQQERGVIQTGMITLFAPDVSCRLVDSEIWALDYSGKRGKPAHHKGIDIPAPRGTPIHAVADGIVVGKFLNEKNAKGIEIVLRHNPSHTGLPVWTYSQYTHLLELPDIPMGAVVKMGDEIGKTSNTGISGREAKRKNTGKSKSHSSMDKKRRDALHFAIFYSTSPQYAESEYGIIPLDGYFMDPHAFYRKNGPYDSQSLKNLPEQDKKIPIPYMKDNGLFSPNDTKVIWPYTCW